MGLWLLVPEHLRLGTWDLLRGWSEQPGDRIEPRLALQLVHEAALCRAGVRANRTLSQRGFELLNGLAFVAADTAIHELLNARTVEQAERLQVALGHIRRAMGHYQGQLVAIDPHRLRSYSRRQMRRHCGNDADKPVKSAQTFFALDADTGQPFCFHSATAARTVTQATPPLLRTLARILSPQPAPALILADAEHFAAELIDRIHGETRFDLLVPMRNIASAQQRWQAIPEAQFVRHWAGYATARLPYRLTHSHLAPLVELVQRKGECPGQFTFNAFLCTADRDEVDLLTRDYPKRWHLEEFFNFHQALGWRRAGTCNLHIRYGQMTMALLAQAVTYQLRQRLGEPYSRWDATHFAKDLLQGLDGDIRVSDDTIVVTYYNAPDCEPLRKHFENLPEQLRAEQIRPEIPWLYGFKLDFRFK